MDKIVSYDYKENILYVNKGKRVKDSLQIGNFVIDFSFKDKVVGIEIMEASKSISFLSGVRITKKDLKNIEHAEVNMKEGKGIIYVILLISFEGKKEVRNPLVIPTAAS